MSQMSNRRKNLSVKRTSQRSGSSSGSGTLTTILVVSDPNQALSIVDSSTSMMGMSSFTAYTRWHCVHFKLSGLCRYSRACLHAGQTRISSSSLAIMRALYATRDDHFTTEGVSVVGDVLDGLGGVR